MNQEDFSSSSLIYSIPDFPVYANFCPSSKFDKRYEKSA